MDIRVDRLRDELQWITDNPDVHRQSRWIIQLPCGTAGCLAGWTVLHEPDVEPDWDDTDSWGHAITDSVLTPQGTRDVSDWAQAILGLDDLYAHLLFDPGNSILDLWRIAAEITDGAIQVPVGVAGGV